jgi:hypothetical protein
MALKLTPEQEFEFADQIVWQNKILWNWIRPIDLIYLEKKYMGESMAMAWWRKSVGSRRMLDLLEPINCVNWVIKNTKYIPDLEQHHKIEHWPLPEGVLETMADDCDGLAILISSILWSLGHRHVHLTVGRYKEPDEPVSRFLPPNHAWVIVYNLEDWPSSLESYNEYTGYILEGTGDTPFAKLPSLADMNRFYVPYWSGVRMPLSVKGAIYAHGPWEHHILGLNR